MSKYRVKERIHKNGTTSYVVQFRILFIFYHSVTSQIYWSKQRAVDIMNGYIKNDEIIKQEKIVKTKNYY